MAQPDPRATLRRTTLPVRRQSCKVSSCALEADDPRRARTCSEDPVACFSLGGLLQNAVLWSFLDPNVARENRPAADLVGSARGCRVDETTLPDLLDQLVVVLRLGLLEALVGGGNSGAADSCRDRERDFPSRFRGCGGDGVRVDSPEKLPSLYSRRLKMCDTIAGSACFVVVRPTTL